MLFNLLLLSRTSASSSSRSSLRDLSFPSVSHHDELTGARWHGKDELSSSFRQINNEGDLDDYMKLAIDTETFHERDALSSRLSSSLRLTRWHQETSESHQHPQMMHKIRHTGTTIAGCIAEGGDFVVIAADSRATEGSTVADKQCEKVHKLAENIWCCGAGTSADNDALLRQLRYSFLLEGAVNDCIGNFKIYTQSPPWDKRGIAMVPAVCRRIRNVLHDAKGNLGVNLVLGGFDFSSDRATLTAIHPHGSMDVVPFTALGSGGLAAMGVLEAGYNPDMKLDDAIDLVRSAIAAGITNDLGSGSQVDLCIIGRRGVRYHRAYVKEEELPVTENDESTSAELHLRHSSGEEDQRSGVGGFGSLPYAVKTKRLIMESDDAIDEARHKWLEDMFDLV